MAVVMSDIRKSLKATLKIMFFFFNKPRSSKKPFVQIFWEKYFKHSKYYEQKFQG